MRIHILGICGTFMGGVAVLAKQLGHEVSGCDANIYPPMSTQLEQQGIKLIEGFDAAQLQPAPDLIIVGNAMKRGNPCIEYMLNHNMRFTSGPAWLADYILQGRWVLGVAGTHGKTTTTSILTWILEYAGFNPNFLIGGVPENFGVSARYTGSDFFVIEADEYDSAFFDKRSKFIHYRPRTAILNNLEFDHADIFENLAEIQKQFQHLVRELPGEGLILTPTEDKNLAEVIAKGCWTPVQNFSELGSGDWQAQHINDSASEFDVVYQGKVQGRVISPLLGLHNIHNVLAAIAAAHHVGVTVASAIEAIKQFKNVKRRLELRGIVNDIAVYDDFAHHPTAIDATIGALRGKVGHARILAVLECGSYTMRTGVHKDCLADALVKADAAFILKPKQANWDLQESMRNAHIPVQIFETTDQLIEALSKNAKSGDQVLVMSNSGFEGVHEKLLDSLKTL